MTPDVAVVMGSWDRRAQLQACVASLRAAANGLRVVSFVADGDSVDGTRAWLADQPDCVLLDGGRAGAVAAFNVAFAAAVDSAAPWILQFNDDLILHGDLRRPAALMSASAAVGAVAFPSTRYSPGVASFNNMRYHGRNYCNQGLFRRAAGMAAARFLGDPAGKRWWDPTFHTYASDTVLGLCLWRLGWSVAEDGGCWVDDGYTRDAGHLDPLRVRNLEQYTNADAFVARWGDPRSIEYSRADAERCGGRLM